MAAARQHPDDKEQSSEAERRPHDGGRGPWRVRFSDVRDPILFFFGLAGIAHQALFMAPNVSLELIGAYITMIGAVPVLRADEARRGDR
jgi:hypothetical protein